MPRPPEIPVAFRTLYKSPVVTIRDYTCRAARGGPQVEEECVADSVVLLRRGVFSRHFGRRSVAADVNEASFFAKGSTYRVSHAADCGDRGTMFEVAPRVLADVVRDLSPAAGDSGRVFPFATGPCDAGVFWRHRRLVRSLEDAAAPADPLRADEEALGLVAGVLASAFERHGSRGTGRRPGTDVGHAERVEATKAVLGSRMTDRLTLGEVADAVGVSPFHLARLFRRRTGVSIHRYLTRLRLRASLERLAEGAEDLTDLALDLGFASHSHFSDVFRREFACTPSDVRRRASARTLRETGRIPEV